MAPQQIGIAITVQIRNLGDLPSAIPTQAGGRGGHGSVHDPLHRQSGAVPPQQIGLAVAVEVAGINDLSVAVAAKGGGLAP